MSKSCKICGSEGVINLGSVDSNRVYNLEDPFPLGKSGIELVFWSCQSCRFIFTRDWDNKDSKFFNNEIYNSDYIKYVDPDFISSRSTQITPALLSFVRIISESLFGNSNIKLLDYGSGNAQLQINFENAGKKLYSYDPYSSKNVIPKNIKFHIIFCIEVFEHEPQPRFLINNLDQLTTEDGIIIFSTKLSKSSNLNWEYIAPRNGHLSIYSHEALKVLASNSGFVYYKLAFFHILSKKKLTYNLIIKLFLLEIKHRIFREIKKYLSRFSK